MEVRSDAMKLENLEIGMVVKNYPELCKLLDVDKLGGNAKIRQLEWFEDYFSYKKDGHKFVIRDIFNVEVEPMEDRRGGDHNPITYIPLMEKLTLDLMLKAKDNILSISKTKLFSYLNMANKNYGVGKGNIETVSAITKIDIGCTEDWFNSVGAMMESNVNKTIQSLENQSLIVFSKATTVCINKIVEESMVYTGKTGYDEEGNEFKIHEKVATEVIQEYRNATKEEDLLIIRIESEVMDRLECKNKQHVMAKKLWKSFKNSVDAELKKRSNIQFYYTSYIFLFNKDIVEKKSKILEQFLLTQKERTDIEYELNNEVATRVDTNAEKRHIKSKKCLGVSKSYRAKDNYTKNSTTLTDMFIRPNNEDIEYKIRKHKIDRSVLL